MSEEESLGIIRAVFADVAIERIVVEYDPIVPGRVAKVFVREDRLEAALGDNGAKARRAAMESGLDVEVVVAED